MLPTSGCKEPSQADSSASKEAIDFDSAFLYACCAGPGLSIASLRRIHFVDSSSIVRRHFVPPSRSALFVASAWVSRKVNFRLAPFLDPVHGSFSDVFIPTFGSERLFFLLLHFPLLNYYLYITIVVLIIFMSSVLVWKQRKRKYHLMHLPEKADLKNSPKRHEVKKEFCTFSSEQ